MRTKVLKKEEVCRKWWLVDAQGKVLGRLATRIATILMGKHRPDYTPHVDNGDFVIVVNADKFHTTGKKRKEKTYYHHSGYPGGLKERTMEELLAKNPTRVLYLAVRGMLPKNRLRDRRMKRLKLYSGEDHPHQAQKPEILEV
ncbi:50S ribosomal protein L13 [candidate division WOR-3 bacterium]|uniref:Large ribosomal subunit protein uL13 n=1 Tax=candidate division WOR-3 bacterium TaxID=2052148 RepID=A0A660SFA6_UNCW3|nr:MAG: 50S ribosomal protein L13 [candidate division WOR-3 bacterium]